MAKCKSCGAEIMWLKMELSGKAMPVDAKAVSVVVTTDRIYGRISRAHISHFATCPLAKKHRKSDKIPAPSGPIQVKFGEKT